MAHKGFLLVALAAVVLPIVVVCVRWQPPPPPTPLPSLPQCARPRGPIHITPRSWHGRKVTTTNVTQLECAKNFRWGGNGGWHPSVPRGEVDNAVMLGQNLEDAVIVERFFRGGPLAHLSRGIEPGGYFLEMGALDGITFSNTRLFEHCLGWDGLLIEAQPTNAERCKRNRPCAEVWGFGICDKDTKFLRMAGANGVAFDTGIHPDSKEVASVRVPCVPLSELLRRNNVRRINFLSLDVEGAELKVLQTVDWSALQVDVLMVEAELSQNSQFALAPSELRGKIDAVRAYLTSVGFTQVPSRVQCNSTSTRTPCHRNGQKLDPMYLGIAGSDLFVGNLALLEYDREPWRRGAR